jgi:hypothetical protein
VWTVPPKEDGGKEEAMIITFCGKLHGEEVKWEAHAASPPPSGDLICDKQGAAWRIGRAAWCADMTQADVAIHPISEQRGATVPRVIPVDVPMPQVKPSRTEVGAAVEEEPERYTLNESGRRQRAPRG